MECLAAARWKLAGRQRLNSDALAPFSRSASSRPSSSISRYWATRLVVADCAVRRVANLQENYATRICSFTNVRPIFARSDPTSITRVSRGVGATRRAPNWTIVSLSAVDGVTTLCARSAPSDATADSSGAVLSSATTAPPNSGSPSANNSKLNTIYTRWDTVGYVCPLFYL